MLTEIKSTKQLAITYEFIASPFGQILIASTTIGICYLGFSENEDQTDLVKRFPEALFSLETKEIHHHALEAFLSNKDFNSINLHLKGTPFQLTVWKTLLTIPMGTTNSYGTIAQLINKPKAYRAVGTAVGKNPVSLLIPCHRVLQSSGDLGGYMWGKERKKEILTFEKEFM